MTSSTKWETSCTPQDAMKKKQFAIQKLTTVAVTTAQLYFLSFLSRTFSTSLAVNAGTLIMSPHNRTPHYNISQIGLNISNISIWTKQESKYISSLQRTFPYPNADAINTNNDSIQPQTALLPKKRKAPIPVEWTRDEIESAYDQYGAQYGLKKQTRKQTRAYILQQHFQKSKCLSQDDICRCLDMMKVAKRTEQRFSTTYEPDTDLAIPTSDTSPNRQQPISSKYPYNHHHILMDLIMRWILSPMMGIIGWMYGKLCVIYDYGYPMEKVSEQGWHAGCWRVKESFGRYLVLQKGCSIDAVVSNRSGNVLVFRSWSWRCDCWAPSRRYVYPIFWGRV